MFIIRCPIKGILANSPFDFNGFFFGFAAISAASDSDCGPFFFLPFFFPSGSAGSAFTSTSGSPWPSFLAFSAFFASRSSQILVTSVPGSGGALVSMFESSLTGGAPSCLSSADCSAVASISFDFSSPSGSFSPSEGFIGTV
jgi:hypothetical protein